MSSGLCKLKSIVRSYKSFYPLTEKLSAMLMEAYTYAILHSHFDIKCVNC